MYDDNFLQETLHRAFEDQESYQVPKGIVRYDYVKAHGWWVRVRRDKAYFKRLFYDSVCGSAQESLRQAILYRHELLSNFPVTIKHVNKRSLSTDPEERIKRLEDKARGKKKAYKYWMAKWYDQDHNIKNKSFSTVRFGEEGAKALALEATIANHNKKPKLSKHPDLYKEQNFSSVLRADVEVLASIDSTRKQPEVDKNKDIISNDSFAFEGERKLKLHKIIERDRQFRNQKISSFLDSHGELFCELCHFNFLKAYPFLSTDIIEVHHIVPLGALSKGATISLSDLMLLCSNCHFAIHQGDAEENLLIAKELFKSLNVDN